jgi:hypothetical protein
MAVVAQDGDGEPVERDHANAAGGLGVTEGQLATVVLELLADDQRPCCRSTPHQRSAQASPRRGPTRVISRNSG